jgi:hypothetical protein
MQLLLWLNSENVVAVILALLKLYFNITRVFLLDQF